MSDWLSTLLLGLIEGITEFLPVSSTGHLLLAEHWLGHRSELFNVVIQCGAVLAVLTVFLRRVTDLVLRWNLPEKFGKASAAIHASVPQFATTIGPAAHSFLERLTVEKPIWRLNWTIHDSDTLFAPHPVPGRDDLTPANVLANVFLRVERQTLCRLPATGAVVFTIRTHLNPILDAIPTPETTRLLLQTLELLPAALVAYRSMAKLITPLKDALSTRLQSWLNPARP